MHSAPKFPAFGLISVCGDFNSRCGNLDSEGVLVPLEIGQEFEVNQKKRIPLKEDSLVISSLFSVLEQ